MSEEQQGSEQFAHDTERKLRDRIEQLERERDEEGINHLAWKLEAEATQANLIKAVEALRFYAEGEWPEDYPGGVLHDVDGVTHIDYGHRATTTLAELEGKKCE
jgi:hypothetical protein